MKFVYYSIFIIFFVVIATVIFPNENRYKTEGAAFRSIETTIVSSYDNDEQISIVKKLHDQDIVTVFYIVNDAHLVCEQLAVTEAGFKRIVDSRLTIGGIPLKDADYKIRTFVFREGPWSEKGQRYSYVTFGYIQEPESVDMVEIRYEGKYTLADVENNFFYHITSSDQKWDPIHPIIFLNDSNEVVGGYMDGLLSLDGYCH